MVSLAAMIVSLILIPFFIDMMITMEDFRTKSERQVAILNRNFLFMIINLFFLNLTGLTTIKSFLYEIEKQSLQTWPQFLATNLLTNYNFFVSYFIQLMFLSVGFWLLDVPHQIAKGVKYCIHKAKYSNKTNKKFIDTYAYDLGYHTSYALTTF